MKSFKKILSIIAVLGLSMLLVANVIACNNKQQRYNYQLLLTLQNKFAYRLKFDSNNNWYIVSKNKLIIGKDKTIIKTINIKDLILTLFINQKNNDWYVGTVNGNIYTGNITSENIERLVKGLGTENYSIYCDQDNNWYAGYSNGDILQGNKDSKKFNFLKNVKTFVLSINNYNNKILFGLGNGQILDYQINDKSWATLKIFKNEQIYNLINNNKMLYVLTNQNNFYQLQNNIWRKQGYVATDIIYNMTINQKGDIYAGGNISGNIYKINYKKINKITNISDIDIIDIKINQNKLYILSEKGQLYKLNLTLN